MGLDLTKLWDLANNLLEAGNEFVETQVESVYGTLSLWLKTQVEKTDTEFDDNALKIVEIGIRDRLIKKYPLEDFPLD